MTDYEFVKVLGQGAYGRVFEVSKDGQKYAFKCPIVEGTDLPLSVSVREIDIITRLQKGGSGSKHIVDLSDVLFCNPIVSSIQPLKEGKDDIVTLVFPLALMDGASFINSTATTRDRKKFMYQMAKGMEYMHHNGIMHRDLKPENVLLFETDTGYDTKICDFGLAEQINDLPKSVHVVTMWYRPPELFYHSNYYSEKIDVWSFGCILFEMFTGTTLYQHSTSKDMYMAMQKTHGILSDQQIRLYYPNRQHKRIETIEDGTEHTPEHFRTWLLAHFGSDIEKRWPDEDDQKDFINLLERTLDLNPSTRWSFDLIVQHPFFGKKKATKPKRRTHPRFSHHNGRKVAVEYIEALISTDQYKDKMNDVEYYQLYASRFLAIDLVDRVLHRYAQTRSTLNDANVRTYALVCYHIAAKYCRCDAILPLTHWTENKEFMEKYEIIAEQDLVELEKYTLQEVLLFDVYRPQFIDFVSHEQLDRAIVADLFLSFKQLDLRFHNQSFSRIVTHALFFFELQDAESDH